MHRDPLTSTSAEEDGKGLDRRRQGTLIGVAVAAVLLVWFALANLRDVQIDFWVDNRQAPLIVVIVISGLLGALITALVMRRQGAEGVLRGRLRGRWRRPSGLPGRRPASLGGWQGFVTGSVTACRVRARPSSKLTGGGDHCSGRNVWARFSLSAPAGRANMGRTMDVEIPGGRW